MDVLVLLDDIGSDGEDRFAVILRLYFVLSQNRHQNQQENGRFLSKKYPGLMIFFRGMRYHNYKLQV